MYALDLISIICQSSIGTCGVLLNVFFIYLVFFRSSKQLHAYSVLLLDMSINDLVASLCSIYSISRYEIVKQLQTWCISATALIHILATKESAMHPFFLCQPHFSDKSPLGRQEASEFHSVLAASSHPFHAPSPSLSGCTATPTAWWCSFSASSSDFTYSNE